MFTVSSTCLEPEGSPPGTFPSLTHSYRLPDIIVRGKGTRHEADHVTTSVFSVYLFTFYLSDPNIISVLFEATCNPLNPELNPICYLLALLGAHHFLHVSRIRVKSLTFRRLMSYIYGAPILDVSRSHTTTQHSR